MEKPEVKKVSKLLALMVTQDDDGRFVVHYVLKNGTSGGPSRSFSDLDEALDGIRGLWDLTPRPVE